jgi:hypothetical protein
MTHRPTLPWQDEITVPAVTLLYFTALSFSSAFPGSLQPLQIVLLPSPLYDHDAGKTLSRHY